MPNKSPKPFKSIQRATARPTWQRTACHPCTRSCHKIGTCVTDVLEKCTRRIDGLHSRLYKYHDDAPEVFELIDSAKALVTYAKQTGINKKLVPKLQQGCKTRWNGLFIILNSIYCNYEQKRAEFVAARKTRHFDKVDYELLVVMIGFLHVFRLATLALEAFNTPTLHLIGYWRARIIEHLEPRTSSYTIPNPESTEPDIECPPDSESIINIKRHILESVKEKWLIKAIHCAAAILDPRQKCRLADFGYTAQLIEDGYAIIKDKMHFCGTGAPANNTKKRPAVPVAKSKLELDRISDDSEDESDTENDQYADAELSLRIASEINDYKKLRLTKEEKMMLNIKDDSKSGHRSGSLLAWWKEKSHAFPILARAVRSILCIPASSSKSENNFSDAGNTITDKRNRLKPKTVDALMFIRSNSDLKT